MEKYTDEYRLAAVKAYVDGTMGYRRVSAEFNVDISQLRQWVCVYQIHGVVRLGKRGRRYDEDFKCKVIEYKRKHHLSVRQTVAHFGLPNTSQVSIWERWYDHRLGEDALINAKRKALVIMSKQPKAPASEETKDSEKTREQLLAELEYLRMENAYLKEWEALQEQKRRRLRKKP